MGITSTGHDQIAGAFTRKDLSRGLGCVIECGEYLGIGIGSTVIIPKGYKPLAVGWSAATTHGGESPDREPPPQGSQRDALLSPLRGELARDAVFPVVFAPLDHRLMANGKNPFGIQTLLAGIRGEHEKTRTKTVKMSFPPCFPGFLKWRIGDLNP